MKTITLKIDLSVKQILVKLFVILPIIVFFILFYKYTVDFPINDDYGVTLGFLNDFLNADTINGKISSLLEQCNEHRIVYDKIWTIISYKLFGLVNFNFLSLIGNLSLVYIFYIFYKEFKKLKDFEQKGIVFNAINEQWLIFHEIFTQELLYRINNNII